MYRNENLKLDRENARKLKDDYEEYMANMNRPAAKLEMKAKAPKNLVRHKPFIQI